LPFGKTTAYTATTPEATPGSPDSAEPGRRRFGRSNERLKVSSAIGKDKPKGVPLTAHHAVGQWCKKIGGKQFCFGKLDDPDGAQRRYLAEKDDLAAGKKPREKAEANRSGLTTRDLVNRYLTFKRGLVDSKELSPRTCTDDHDSCELFLRAAGKD